MNEDDLIAKDQTNRSRKDVAGYLLASLRAEQPVADLRHNKVTGRAERHG